MLKKIVKFNLVLVFIISLIGSFYFAAKDIKVRNWHKTTLTVTFIGLPDGNVFGDYTDANGVQHKNEPAFFNCAEGATFFGIGTPAVYYHIERSIEKTMDLLQLL